MKKIAVITGASSGLGRAYAKRVVQILALDEIWLIARREERLREVAAEIGETARILPLDVTRSSDLEALRTKLASASASIRCLINCAGMGKIAELREQSARDVCTMIDLNCRALAEITSIGLPYMTRGAWILEIGSIAGFQPMPGFAVYAATKAFVESYSKSLHAELQKDGIHVTCVCPYWVKDTEFIEIAADKHKDYAYKPLATLTDDVVEISLKDVSRNRSLSTPGVMSTVERFLSKLLPDAFIMSILNHFRKLS